MALTAHQRDYLRDHVWAVLATGRTDGSPQVSMVGYALDDADRLLISAKSHTAKWHNARRQPKVALVVPDGRRQLVVYGTAEAIDTDPDRVELTADVWGRIGGGGTARSRRAGPRARRAAPHRAAHHARAGPPERLTVPHRPIPSPPDPSAPRRTTR